MIVFCTNVDDSNIIKIIIGPESQALNAVNGLINIDLDEILETIKNIPASKNIIQISFCNNEDDVTRFLSQNSSKINSISKSDTQRKIRKAKCPTCSGDALIDSEGNIHPCEACLKIDAFKRGLEKGQKQAESQKRKSQPKRKSSSSKRKTILMEYDNGESKDNKCDMD